MQDDIKNSTGLAVDMFLSEVSATTAEHIAGILAEAGLPDQMPQLVAGKMLRSRLAARIAARDPEPQAAGDLVRLCAAVELVHTASLLHDDVVDGGLVRRMLPTLWRESGTSAAVLIGDIILSCALGIVARTSGGRYVATFSDKVGEVCTAEVEQELKLRGKQLSVPKCLEIARGKTGPLFAFVGLAAGRDDAALSKALEESGYLIGTAYQVFDDLLDVVGTDEVAKKTLGTDSARSNYTIAHGGPETQAAALEHVQRLCRESLECVANWPGASEGLSEYLYDDLWPVFNKQLEGAGLSLCLTA